jgi:hypothetical protein
MAILLPPYGRVATPPSCVVILFAAAAAMTGLAACSSSSAKPNVAQDSGALGDSGKEASAGDSGTGDSATTDSAAADTGRLDSATPVIDSGRADTGEVDSGVPALPDAGFMSCSNIGSSCPSPAGAMCTPDSCLNSSGLVGYCLVPCSTVYTQSTCGAGELCLPTDMSPACLPAAFCSCPGTACGDE